MKSEDISWSDFKQGIAEHISQRKGPRLCRGQSNSAWSLVSSFHRNPNGLSFLEYFQIVHSLADIVGTAENRIINVRDDEENGSFLAYIQHHGFPTPLLDWTLSPYIAAFFAFSEVDSKEPAVDKVSIFVFDFMEWMKDWKQVYNYTVNDPHVTILAPKALGNKRQIIQQSNYYTFTNVPDIAEHMTQHERVKNKTYLNKYDISVKERTNIMLELEAMGITAFSLFGDTDSLCRRYKETVFRADQVGKIPSERMADFLRIFSKPKKSILKPRSETSAALAFPPKM